MFCSFVCHFQTHATVTHLGLFFCLRILFIFIFCLLCFFYNHFHRVYFVQSNLFFFYFVYFDFFFVYFVKIHPVYFLLSLFSFMFFSIKNIFSIQCIFAMHFCFCVNVFKFFNHHFVYPFCFLFFRRTCIPASLGVVTLFSMVGIILITKPSIFFPHGR